MNTVERANSQPGIIQDDIVEGCIMVDHAALE
jgi:hypothetical protein